MDIHQLNALLQRFPAPVLGQIGQQYGMAISAWQIERIKTVLQQKTNNNSTLQDVEAILSRELAPPIAKKLLRLMQQYFQ